MATRKLREEAELFHAYLRQNGLKKTYQKDLILETFLNTEGHLSVDDIYALVKKRDKRVGVVTVFRTMKSLTACGIAKEIVLGDGLTRFEHSYHHPAHHHIVCMQCGKTIEYVSPALDEIQDEIIQRYGFLPLHHKFQTYGICEDCREKRPVAESEMQDTERVFARDAIKMILCMTDLTLGFYRSAAGRNLDPGGKEVLEKMIREEENFAADMRQRLDELMGYEKQLERTPVFLHFDPQVLAALIPDTSEMEKAGELRLGTQACSDLALELHRRTTGFFESYADRFPETHGKRILLQFAERESSHGKDRDRTLEETQDHAGGVS